MGQYIAKDNALFWFLLACPQATDSWGKWHISRQCTQNLRISTAIHTTKCKSCYVHSVLCYLCFLYNDSAASC